MQPDLPMLCPSVFHCRFSPLSKITYSLSLGGQGISVYPCYPETHSVDQAATAAQLSITYLK